MTTNLSVNGSRLWDTLMVSAGIGTGPGAACGA